MLAGLKAAGAIDTVRATPNMLGAAVEATFPSMVALAALALSRKAFYRPADETGFEPAATAAPEAIVVNAWGIWRGEGMGLVAAVDVTGKEGVMGSKVRDHRGRPVVAVTGIGVVSSLGVGLDDNWAALAAGRSGHQAHHAASRPSISAPPSPAPIDFMQTSDTRGPDAARSASSPPTKRSAWPASARPAIFPGRCSPRSRRSSWNGRRGGALYDAADPAIADAYDRMMRRRRGASNDRLRSSSASMYGYVAEKLADRFGTKGAPISLTTACASGATAIQLGVEAIRRGDTDAALCVGTDCSVTAEEVIRFSLLSALSNANDDPRGGVEALLQEPRRLRHRRGRGGAGARGLRRGGGARRRDPRRRSAAPPRRPTTSTAPAPSPTARRSSARSARPSTMPASHPDEIDYINAHGTGTPENDKMEAMSLEAVFGERLRGVPISSNKSMIGHTLTAAGAIEAVFSVKTIADRRHPADDQLQGARPDHRSRRRAQRRARRRRSATVLSNSFGFGGQNACLIIAAEPA